MTTNYIQQFFKQFVKDKPELFSVLKLGDLVEGVVLDKGANAVVVDLGRHGTGMVYREEVQNAKDMLREIKIGDPIHAKVIEVDNEEGVVELSLTEAGRQKAWAEIQELQEKDDIIKVKIKGANRGGLIAELAGLSAFLPVSQLSGDHYPRISTDDKTQIMEELQKLVGEELEVKIIDVNTRTNKLIVSEKAATQVSVRELAKNYEVGQVIKGVVSGVADFGAFVKFADNPEIEGLIHISELSHQMIENPKEVIGVDDNIEAKIIEIKDGRISLSLKALQADPWEKVADKFKEGETVSGEVYAYHPYGAVVNLGGGIQGQIHVSEFGGVPEMKKALTPGEKYEFKIESVKPEEKRITLKLLN
jgi:small subunit ribosomal protein S1